MKRSLNNSSLNCSITGLVLPSLLGLHPEPFFESTGILLPILVFLFLFTGLLFFILDYRRLMFISFAVCAGLCLFLKDIEGNAYGLTATQQPTRITVGHFHFPDEPVLLTEILPTIHDMKADVISIQNLARKGFNYLNNYLETSGYQHFYFVEGKNEQDGIAVFSRYPLDYVREARYQTTPDILGKVMIKDFQNLYFISTILPRENNMTSLEPQLKQRLASIADQTNKINEPLLLFGDFHLISQTDQLLHHKKRLNLSNSGRRPGNAVDHIFYSNHFKCISFKTVNIPESPGLGMVGTYEFVVKDSQNAVIQKTSKKL